MKSKIIFIFIILIISVAVFAGSNHELRGKHHEAGLSCVDCHGTDTPEKQAPQSACKSCHEDMEKGKEEAFTDESGKTHMVNPHNSHAGQIRCTLCHKIHNPSVLYCNEGCHHSFKVVVP